MHRLGCRFSLVPIRLHFVSVLLGVEECCLLPSDLLAMFRTLDQGTVPGTTTDMHDVFVPPSCYAPA